MVECDAYASERQYAVDVLSAGPFSEADPALIEATAAAVVASRASYATAVVRMQCDRINAAMSTLREAKHPVADTEFLVRVLTYLERNRAKYTEDCFTTAQLVVLLGCGTMTGYSEDKYIALHLESYGLSRSVGTRVVFTAEDALLMARTAVSLSEGGYPVRAGEVFHAFGGADGLLRFVRATPEVSVYPSAWLSEAVLAELTSRGKDVGAEIFSAELQRAIAEFEK